MGVPLDIAQFPLTVALSAATAADHFPGGPLVPGASLCASIAAEIEARTGLVASELAKLRFNAPVSPGAPLTVRCEPRTEHCWRIRLEADQREVLRGLVTLVDGAEAAAGAAAGAGGSGSFDRPADRGPGRESGPRPVEPLYAALPYGPSMRLLDGIDCWDTDSVSAYAGGHRDPDHPLRLDGRLHGLAALEYAAQGCALHGAALGRMSGEKAATIVVATVQQLRLCGRDLDAAGERLRIDACCVLRQSRSAIYECAVADGLGWWMTATLGLMMIADPAVSPASKSF